MNNAAIAINNSGQIAGISDPPGDATTYAVLWQNGAITNLGTLPGDVSSVAADINARGQVVGSSCDANFNCRAFLWDNGVDDRPQQPHSDWLSAVSDPGRRHQ